MHKLVIFGGTTEGRLLCEWCVRHSVPALYCVATDAGELSLPGITVLKGRLDIAGMTELFLRECPQVVLDATHPYAKDVSANIRSAVAVTGSRLIRVVREIGDYEGCSVFSDDESLIQYLNDQAGNIFVTTGLKEAELFCRIKDFAERVFFRLLPGIDGLKRCIELGYPPSRLILMQGPFSYALNSAMFSDSHSTILVTKDSGKAGGFSEKINAAKNLGMKIALISRPGIDNGLPLEKVFDLLEEILRVGA